MTYQEQTSTHAQLRKLYALDVALVGEKEAFKRWQTKWPDLAYWAPCVEVPRFHSRVDERRDPEAPPLPSWDWHEASEGAVYRVQGSSGPLWYTYAPLAVLRERRPPRAWFAATANMARAQYEALQRLARGERVDSDKRNLTPAQKLGYSIGDEFIVIGGRPVGHRFKSGDHIILIRDDGTSAPRFRRSDNREQFVALSCVRRQYSEPDDPDSEEWIAWSGNQLGRCPLPNDTLFQVKFRDGFVPNSHRAPAFQWGHVGDNNDIIAYRIIEPASDEPECCICDDMPCGDNNPCAACGKQTDKREKPADDGVQRTDDETAALIDRAVLGDGVLQGAAKYRAIADAMDAGECPGVFEVSNEDEDSAWRPPIIGPYGWDDVALARQIRRKPAKAQLTTDALAQEIRRVDGSHSLGAGALAEALMPYLIASTDSILKNTTGEIYE